MNKVVNNLTENVAETLYIPLAMKRKETLRKNAFFQDPYACELLEKIDYDFSKYDKAIRSSVGVAIRSRYFDDQTKAFIEQHDNPVVVHIGCGLDTRFQRLGSAITNKAVFYEVDLPEVMQLRKALLPLYLRFHVRDRLDGSDQGATSGGRLPLGHRGRTHVLHCRAGPRCTPQARGTLQSRYRALRRCEQLALSQLSQTRYRQANQRSLQIRLRRRPRNGILVYSTEFGIVTTLRHLPGMETRRTHELSHDETHSEHQIL